MLFDTISSFLKKASHSAGSFERETALKNVVCTECKIGTMIATKVKGEVFSLPDFGKVKMLYDVEVKRCDQCESHTDHLEDPKFIKALEGSVSGNIQEMLSFIKTKHRILNHQVAQVLSTSSETLSRWKNGDAKYAISPLQFKTLNRIACEGSEYLVRLDMRWEQGSQKRPARAVKGRAVKKLDKKHCWGQLETLCRQKEEAFAREGKARFPLIDLLNKLKAIEDDDLDRAWESVKICHEKTALNQKSLDRAEISKAILREMQRLEAGLS